MVQRSSNRVLIFEQEKQSCSRRTRSTVAPQSLLLMNNADVLLLARIAHQV